MSSKRRGFPRGTTLMNTCQPCPEKIVSAVHSRSTISYLGQRTGWLIQAPANRSDQLNKNFSFWSILGIGFSILNSWFSISTALIDGLSSGGPVQLVYGLVIVTIVYIAIGVCLAELASAMPHAGGQYYWTRQLASPRYARFASYLTGWVAWAGSLCTCASLALGVSSLCVGCIQMAHPEM